MDVWVRKFICLFYSHLTTPIGVLSIFCKMRWYFSRLTHPVLMTYWFIFFSYAVYWINSVLWFTTFKSLLTISHNWTIWIWLVWNQILLKVLRIWTICFNHFKESLQHFERDYFAFELFVWSNSQFCHWQKGPIEYRAFLNTW